MLVLQITLINLLHPLRKTRLPLSKRCHLAIKPLLPIRAIKTIVTGFGVEGTVPRPGNTDPVPEMRGRFRSRHVKTSHDDRISFLDPIPRPHRPRIFVTIYSVDTHNARIYVRKSYPYEHLRSR